MSEQRTPYRTTPENLGRAPFRRVRSITRSASGKLLEIHLSCGHSRLGTDSATTRTRQRMRCYDCWANGVR